MIDNDDIGWFVLLWPPVLCFFGLFFLVMLTFKSCQDTDECSKKHCGKGNPVVMHDQCLCTELAK